MKSKIIWIVTAVLFVALIAGAALLYDELGEENMPDELIIEMPSATTTGTNASNATQNDPPVSDNTPEEGESENENSEPPATNGDEEETENPAPDFTMVDANGNKIKLSDLRGKPVVLNFWASWCGYCLAEMPDFEKAYKTYGDDIHFVMLNTLSGTETYSKAKEVISDNGYTFPVYFDEEQTASYSYGAYAGIPQTFFIDEKGNLVAYWDAMISPALLDKGISLIYK